MLGILRPLLAAVLLAAASAHAQTVVLYSRVDAAQAGWAHALAEVFGPAFIDQQLQPGAEWRPTIKKNICRARVVLLMWSQHAAASNEVRREIDEALWCRRKVVPVLLDDEPLPGRIADTQGLAWKQPARRPTP